MIMCDYPLAYEKEKKETMLRVHFICLKFVCLKNQPVWQGYIISRVHFRVQIQITLWLLVACSSFIRLCWICHWHWGAIITAVLKQVHGPRNHNLSHHYNLKTATKQNIKLEFYSTSKTLILSTHQAEVLIINWDVSSGCRFLLSLRKLGSWTNWFFSRKYLIFPPEENNLQDILLEVIPITEIQSFGCSNENLH